MELPPCHIRCLVQRRRITAFLLGAFLCQIPSYADIVLLGNNDPHGNVNDGDFDLVPGWQVHQSPHWTVNKELSRGGGHAGVAKGVFSTGGKALTVVDSQVINSSGYPTPIAGDVLGWRFVAKSQHKVDARASMSLVFGERIRLVADKVQLPGGPEEAGVYEGTYTITEEDAAGGRPFIRMSLRAEGIAIFLENVDLKMVNAATAGPLTLAAKPTERGIELTWSDGEMGGVYNLYRKPASSRRFMKLAGNVKSREFTDATIINGEEYSYLVTTLRADRESSASPPVTARRLDSIAPEPPRAVKAVGLDIVVELSWNAAGHDIQSYSVYRGDADGQNMREITHGLGKSTFVDDQAAKNVVNTYAVVAVDYSGNRSRPSEIARAKVAAVLGSAFIDFIRPMPIHRALRSNLWGADSVLPRDPDNGIEHPDWSYWGGRPVKDKDGKYHMLVVRWPERAVRGHWEWPWSTVVHTVSDLPTGPYTPTGGTAYGYKQGLGHNADVTFLNDGRYLLYSLIDWEPTLLTAHSMQGPWQREGVMTIAYDAEALGDSREYQVQRNLSGLQLEDGSMLFVSKFGRMIKSDSGLLGPYKVLTDVVQKNDTIPKRYRHVNYEDPVMWRDEVQYHQIINAFLAYRGIYLRSPDGIHWKYDSLAFTPDSTFYADGTRTTWYKLERPHVLQDEYGRATHLSLAAIDTVKRQDFANDRHSSKNLIIPLTVYRRLTLLNREPVDDRTRRIEVLIHSEEGFDAQKALDLKSLRFGASEEVNFGRGCKMIRWEKHEDGLVLVFDGKGNGLTKTNFAGKLIGNTKEMQLVVGFSRLVAE